MLTRKTSARIPEMSALVEIPYLLVNQLKMPIIGLGTYKIRGYETCLSVIEHCLKQGYKMFDTAQVYRNESDIGLSLEQLLPKYNLKREDIFLITKIAPNNHGDKCRDSILQSLEKLRTSYVDLVLIHWPGYKGLQPDDPKNAEMRKKTWGVLEQALDDGLVRSIGVSNYTVRHLTELFEHARIRPHLLQTEFHPFLYQKDLVDFCRENSIVFQAYSSLGTSNVSFTKQLFENDLVAKLAAKYSKTPAQILLKWSVQQKIGVIPKSTNLDHITENINIFDFELETKDLDSIKGLNADNHLCWNAEKVF